MRPSIDHTILSPGGKVSRRAREAAIKREHDRLFPPSYWDTETPGETPEGRRERLLRLATMLRNLAERGMCTRKYMREAAKLEKEAAASE